MIYCVSCSIVALFQSRVSCLHRQHFINSVPKNENLLEMYSPSGHVNDFVSPSEQIWINLALCHLLTIAVNGCRHNESPNS